MEGFKMETRTFKIAKSNERGATLIQFEFFQHGAGYRVGFSLYPDDSTVSILSWAPAGADIRKREASFEYATRRAAELHGVELGAEVECAALIKSAL